MRRLHDAVLDGFSMILSISGDGHSVIWVRQMTTRDQIFGHLIGLREQNMYVSKKSFWYQDGIRRR